MMISVTLNCVHMKDSLEALGFGLLMGLLFIIGLIL